VYGDLHHHLYYYLIYQAIPYILLSLPFFRYKLVAILSKIWATSKFWAYHLLHQLPSLTLRSSCSYSDIPFIFGTTSLFVSFWHPLPLSRSIKPLSSFERALHYYTTTNLVFRSSFDLQKTLLFKHSTSTVIPISSWVGRDLRTLLFNSSAPETPNRFRTH
jgi:hypothetical protein